MKVKSLSRVRLLATPWTAAYQAPPSMGFSRQGYWSGVPSPSLPHPPSLYENWEEEEFSIFFFVGLKGYIFDTLTQLQIVVANVKLVLQACQCVFFPFDYYMASHSSTLA